jgi:hypothetical protein
VLVAPALLVGTFPVGDVRRGREYPNWCPFVVVGRDRPRPDPAIDPLAVGDPELPDIGLAGVDRRLQALSNLVAVLRVDRRLELSERVDVAAEQLDDRLVPEHLVRLQVPLGDPGVRPCECQFESLALLLEVVLDRLAVDLVAHPPPEQVEKRLLGLAERTLS